MEAVSSDTKNSKYFIDWKTARTRMKRAWEKSILSFHCTKEVIKVYGIPRGGIFCALLLCSLYPGSFIIAESEEEADLFVDDIIDSGATKTHYETKYPHIPFIAMIENKTKDIWYEFPWETAQNEIGPEENIRRIIEYIGEDVTREGLIETPKRVVKSYDTLFGGYKIDPASVLKIFKEDSSDEMIILKDIEFYSTCEHHILPFFGKAHIAYIPSDRVVGISKLARLLEVFSRRLQIQERLCQQITETLMENLNPKGAGCILEAQHFCMTARGVQKQNSIMVTSSLEGAFRKPEVRNEFFQILRMP